MTNTDPTKKEQSFYIQVANSCVRLSWGGCLYINIHLEEGSSGESGLTYTYIETEVAIERVIIHKQYPGGLMSQVVGLPNNSYTPHQYGMGSRPALYITKNGALESQPQVIKFTSCLSMVGGSLRVLRLLPPLKPVSMIQLKYC